MNSVADQNRKVSMETHSLLSARATRFLGIIVGTSALIGFRPSIAVSAPTAPPKSKAATASPAAAAKKPQIARTRDAWHKSLLLLPRPETGCHTSSFPRVEWKPIPCTTPPPYPMPPARGRAKPFIVGGGGGNDFAARPTGTISSADGSFVSVSAGITEAGQFNATGAQISNAYTLQLNTNFFTSTACAASPNANCKGWEQFVYMNDNSNHAAFIQYWLIQYNTTCPAGWIQFQFPPPSTDIYCFRNSPGAVSLTAAQPVSNFANMTLTGAATTSSDGVTMTVGASAFTTAGSNLVNAAAGWTDAEFNVFGDAGGGQANFGANSTLRVRTTVHNGTKTAPACSAESFTGETNNLTLVGTAPILTQPSPAVEFTESNVAGSTAACVTAAGIGDTHLSTFGGLLYDFQASGDFVLAQTDKDFVVQARQVSGAPSWPDASVNKAVATRMGGTRVAVCTAPSRLAVDGISTEVVDGKTLSLPSGVGIMRTGNVYVVVDQSGNSMRAEVNDTYINVTVGLGRWPTNVHGILANANGHVNEIEARTGTVLRTPLAFSELYHEYADSWRVPAKESLLSVCGDREVEAGIPKKPFEARNLDPQVYKRARAVCAAAGVKVKSLLDACVLDVAVIGRETAAKVFADLRAPAAVGRIVSSRGGSGK
jgi:hypothetical protein